MRPPTRAARSTRSSGARPSARLPLALRLCQRQGERLPQPGSPVEPESRRTMTADRDPAERASARFQRAAGRRAGRASLWRWWTGELAPLVPRSTRTAVRRRRMRPVLAFDGDTATLWTPVMRGVDIVMEAGTPIQLSDEGCRRRGAHGARFAGPCRRLAWRAATGRCLARAADAAPHVRRCPRRSRKT